MNYEIPVKLANTECQCNLDSLNIRGNAIVTVLKIRTNYIINYAILFVMAKSKLLEMHNVGIVVESLDNAVSFFEEIGLTLEGRMMVEGDWAGRVTGLGNQSVEIAMMVTPDGHTRIELSRFLKPQTIADHRTAPVNSLGYLRIMFRVDNLEELLARLLRQGANIVGEVVNYENIYRLCYIRGTEGILVGLAEQVGTETAQDILEKN